MVGEKGQVKVLDFGLARRFLMPGTGEILLHGSTIPGRPLGTANSMAPERMSRATHPTHVPVSSRISEVVNHSS